MSELMLFCYGQRAPESPGTPLEAQGHLTSGLHNKNTARIHSKSTRLIAYDTE